MNPIQLIFKLLLEFSLLETSDYSKYKDEAAMWWASIRIDEGDEKNPVAKDWKYYLKLYSSHWYVAVGLALLYFPLKRFLIDYQNPTNNDDLEED